MTDIELAKALAEFGLTPQDAAELAFDRRVTLRVLMARGDERRIYHLRDVTVRTAAPLLRNIKKEGWNIVRKLKPEIKPNVTKVLL